ncbi:hypothetical protein [Actinomadura sp. K4S16]|nr:hypothetical protein [Actinomadura sp. K4S16]
MPCKISFRWMKKWADVTCMRGAVCAAVIGGAFVTLVFEGLRHLIF